VLLQKHRIIVDVAPFDIAVKSRKVAIPDVVV